MKKLIRVFLLGIFSHLRKNYKTHNEFEQHLFSGEVTISVKDLEIIINQNSK